MEKMNNKLQEFARNEIKKGLAKLPEDWQRRFKLMYAQPANLDNTEKANMEINEVVNDIPSEKLDWAMKQVENSIKELNKK